MQLPVAITFRGLRHSNAVEQRVRHLAKRLDRVCHRITRCDVVIERPHRHPEAGSGYRVRLDITVPPHHEIVVRREPTEGEVYDDLYEVVASAFAAARRRLRKLSQIQRGHVKRRVGTPGLPP